MGIGKQLKNIRKDKDITLSEIAEKTELSVGFLSNLERDQTSPTIDVLHKICNVLNITINDVLAPDVKKQNPDEAETDSSLNPEENIVRYDDRKLLFQEKDGSLSYSSMTKGNTDFKVSAMTLKGDQLFTFSKHDHDELGIIISGSMEMKIEEKSFFLYPGDTIYIKAGTLHAGKKTSEEPCVSNWVKLSADLNDLVKK